MMLFIISQIFYEGFEGTQFPPSGWTNTGTRNFKWVRRTSGVVFGTASAGVSVAQTSRDSGTAILQTPLINLPSINPNDTIIFSFYYKLPSVGGAFDTRFRSTDTLKVQISNDGNNWTNLIVWDSTSLYTGANNQPKKVQFNISSYQNTNIYIRWIFIDKTYDTVNYNSYFNIDSVFVGVKTTKSLESKNNFIKIMKNTIEINPTEKPLKLEIYSPDGKIIYSTYTNQKKLLSLRKGIYFIIVYDNKKVVLRKKIGL
ncbi:MAG: choice-of-anchor J domain-containing protein [candidate division WOR-3 bacterium]